MLSILIPIYNYKVVPLVDALQKQCVKTKINYEILCFDDQSDVKYKKLNNALSDYFRVNYTELSENIGRARIRNWLAKSASYDTLLFLDCDSKIVNKNFIENYISLIGKSPVISGGRIYKNKEPRAYTKRLHWLYGTKKESQNSKVRNRYPVKYFHSNNFLVDRQVILDNPFEEQLAKYGYEDLLYARQLQDQNIEILHVDNSIEHLGLEKNTKFLEKTKLAIDNLLFLKYAENEAIPTNIEQFANRLYDFGFHEDFMKYYDRRKDKIQAVLMSKNPTLRALDMYKLHYYYDQRNAWIRGES